MFKTTITSSVHDLSQFIVDQQYFVGKTRTRLERHRSGEIRMYSGNRGSDPG